MIHSDNGPKVVNMALVSHFGVQMIHIDLIRGRPSYKNDNHFVEQKNVSLVRVIAQTCSVRVDWGHEHRGFGR
jgi:hypothetical protein